MNADDVRVHPNDRPFWFADVDEGQDGPFKWRPYLQDGGCVASLDVWFESEEACLDWLRRIVGNALIDGSMCADPSDIDGYESAS